MLSINPDGAREELARARQMAKDGLEDSRRSVLALRPSSLESSSLADAITREMNRLTRHGISVLSTDEGSPYSLSEPVEGEVFRIVQEVCANIRKHANAGRVEVVSTYDSRTFGLSIADDGVGFDVSATRGGGFGLTTMRERARKAGGELAVDSALGRGTRVTLRVPREHAGAVAEAARKIRVLLADDHAVARQGIRRMLEAEPDIDVVAEAGDGEEALARALSLKPDVVIADVRMPRLTGVELADMVAARGLAARTVILTAHLEGDLIARAMRAGAQGYLLKDVASTELARAVRAVHKGDTYLQAAAASELARRVRDAGEAGILERLTERELEVLRPVVKGLRNKEIARELGITEATVKFHVAHIFEKLGVTSRTEAVVRALKFGLFDSSSTPKGN
jgi:DNA-binding NarL/FixJ family response regulator